jgi:uncharacterized protein YjbJ (UPF0337 family)
MKASTHDRIAGTARQARGKANVGASKVTGSVRRNVKGRIQSAAGKVQKKVGDRERARGR